MLFFHYQLKPILKHKMAFAATILILLSACSKLKSAATPPPPGDASSKTKQNSATPTDQTPASDSDNSGTIVKLKDSANTSDAGSTPVAPHFSNEDANSIQLNSDTCTAIDLSADMDPVKNQKSDNDCYAFTASDLINYQSADKASALAIAIQYGEVQDPSGEQGTTVSEDVDDNVSGLDGGTIAEAIHSATTAGVCYEDDVPSAKGNSRALKIMKDAFDSYQEKKSQQETKKQKHRALTTIYAWSIDVFSGMFTPIWMDNMRNNPSLSEEDAQDAAKPVHMNHVSEILKDEQIVTFELLLRKLLAKSCYRKIPNPLSWAKTIHDRGVKSVSDLSQAFSYLHQTLEKKYPIGVGYETRGLIDRSGGGHASSVVGRKWKQPTDRPAGCYLLIRNSWGTEWPEAEDVAGLKALNDDDHMGYYWVKDTDLANAILSYTQIEI